MLTLLVSNAEVYSFDYSTHRNLFEHRGKLPTYDGCRNRFSFAGDQCDLSLLWATNGVQMMCRCGQLSIIHLQVSCAEQLVWQHCGKEMCMYLCAVSSIACDDSNVPNPSNPFKETDLYPTRRSLLTCTCTPWLLGERSIRRPVFESRSSVVTSSCFWR